MDEKSKYDFELDSAIMDVPASALDSSSKYKVDEMNEDEVRRFSYITSNLKNFNASAFAAGPPLQKQI